MAPVKINNALRATAALWGMCAFGSKDGKISAGEMRPQEEVMIEEPEQTERVCGGEGRRHRITKVV